MIPTPNAARLRLLLSVPCLLAAGASSARAEVEQELDAIVVSASRWPSDAGKTTSAVTVLDPRDLESRGITRLQDALNEVPGVIATSTAGQAGAIGSLLIRGTPTSYSQIVIDGMRLSDSTAPLGNILGVASIQDIGRIEVLRGPQSAMYGGEAIGGVVWMETAAGEGDPGGRVFAEAGSFDSVSGFASTDGSRGDFSWFAGYGYDSTANDVRMNDWDQSRLGLRGDWKASPDATITATLRAFDSRYENHGASLDHLDGLLTTLRASVEFSDVWSAVFHTGFYRESYDSDSSFGNYGTDLDRFSLSTDHLVKIGDHHRALAGAFFEHTSFKNTIGTDEDRDRYGAYLGWEWQPVERFTASATTRWEDYAAYGDEATWRAAFAWKAPVVETIVRGGVGRAFRAPSYLDLFGSQFGLGNRNLVAESSLGWDLGIEKEWLAGHSVTLTWFHNDVEDQIDSFAFPKPVNLTGTSQTQGLEAGLHGGWCDRLVTYRVSYTMLDKALSNLPHHSGKASLEWRPSERWMLGAGVTYLDTRLWSGPSSARPLDDALLFRLYGEYQLAKNVKLHGRIENLGDTYWELFNSKFSPRPETGSGFGMFAGVTVEW